MAIAAVPNYMQERDPEFYLSAPPGHRFLLYFAAWGENAETDRIDWRMKDRVPRMKRQHGHLIQQGWEDLPNDQYACTIAASKTPAFDEEKPRQRKPKSDPGLKPWQSMMNGVAARQILLAATMPTDHFLHLDALATAPFTTGLGNEHPLENGFAFLNPYGLPYLPGSGVKGVLRQAARELASGDWGDTKGWNESPIYPLMQGEGAARRAVHDEHTKAPVKLSMLDVLFGLESNDGGKVHVRGALVFWDVVPQIKGDSLAVEIMTPHQGHYYQQNPAAGSTNPHDSGQPIPISYLTVPPGSGFTFHVVCDLPFLRRIAPTLAENGHWKALLTAAFEHAFQWLGFGAKTAVGYGAMRENPAARAERERQQDLDRENAERQAMEDRRANLSPDDLAWEDHQPDVETFRQQFESAKKDPYKAGSQFDSRRNDFMKTALTWEDTRSRQAAGELLKSTMTKAWGTPSNKDSKQRLKDAVARLCPQSP